MTSSPIQGISESNQPQEITIKKENVIGRVSADILSHIFSFLDLTCQLIISRVCRQWKEIYTKQFEAFSPPSWLFAGGLTSMSKKVFSKIWKLEYVSSLTDKKIIAQLGNDHYFIDVPTKSSLNIYGVGLARTDQFFFINQMNTVICICIETGNTIFELDLYESPSGYRREDLTGFALISKDPLTFLTVTISGKVATWKLEKEGLQRIDFWNVFDSRYTFGTWDPEVRPFVIGAHVFDSFLFVKLANSKIVYQHAFYSLESKTQSLCGEDIYKRTLHSEKIHYRTGYKEGLRKKTVKHTRSLCFEINESNDCLTCSKKCGEILTEIWKRGGPGDGPVYFLTDPTDHLVLVTNLQEIFLLHAEDGAILKEFAFPFKEEWTAKFYKEFHLLLITFYNRVILIDLKKETVFEKTFDTKEKKIKDASLLGNKIVICTSSDLYDSSTGDVHVIEFFKSSDESTFDPSLKILALEKATKDRIEPVPPADRQAEAENQRLSLSRTETHTDTTLRSLAKEPKVRECQKITALIVGILAVAFFSLAIFFAQHKGINLSIGFGVSSALLALGSLYVARNKQKRFGN